MRLLYDGLDENKLTVLPTSDEKIIVEEIYKHGCDNVCIVTLLKKFNEIIDSAKKYVDGKEAE